MPRFPTFSTSNLVFRMPNFQFSTLDASLFFRLEPHYISHYIKCRSRNKLGECRVFVFGSSYLVKNRFFASKLEAEGKQHGKFLVPTRSAVYFIFCCCVCIFGGDKKGRNIHRSFGAILSCLLGSYVAEASAHSI